jgi:hypothetical protein
MLIQDGSMWLHGLADGVVSDRVALCGLGEYKFHLGSDATKYLTDRESLSWEFKITDDQYTTVFALADGHTMKELCPAEPMTLHAFMTFLERNSQVGISIANHKVDRKKSEKSESEWTYHGQPEGGCVGVITQKFASKKAGRPTWANVGAMLNGKKLKECAHTKVFIKMTCYQRNVAQLGILLIVSLAVGLHVCSHVHCPRYTELKRTITPGYMWLWLQKPIRLSKGQIVELV